MRASRSLLNTKFLSAIRTSGTELEEARCMCVTVKVFRSVSDPLKRQQASI